MTVAAGIDKQTIVHLLDMRPQQSLYVLLRVLGYLLKLIDGENAWFVSLFQITEYLLQRQLRCVDVTQFDIECRHNCVLPILRGDDNRICALFSSVLTNHLVSFPLSQK